MKKLRLLKLNKEAFIISNVNQLYNLSAKVLCGKEATAFFINEFYAVTARHCINENINSHIPIKLRFNQSGEHQEERIATLVDSSEEFDIALIKLDDPVAHISDWPILSSDRVNVDDKWETLGYPENWNLSEHGTDYCYIKGDIFLNSDFEKNTTYDIHLTSNYIKEEWAGMGGLSGSPLMIDGIIKGIIIVEEYSMIKSPVKVISLQRCESFFVKNKIEIGYSAQYNTHHLVKSRIETQKNTCVELFQKLNYSDNKAIMNLGIDCYYMKYNSDGSSKKNELAQYLSQALIEYVCSIKEVEEYLIDIKKSLEVFKKARAFLESLQAKGTLGSLLLWMLLEGVLEVPKLFTLINLSDGYTSSVHVGLKSNKLVFYVGEGLLRQNIDAAVSELSQLMLSLVDIKESIFAPDDLVLNEMIDGNMKDLLNKFVNFNTRDWSDVSVELTVFTGYDSKSLDVIEQRKLDHSVIAQVINQHYHLEYKANLELITSVISENTLFNNIKINWFILPFNKIGDFEDFIINEYQLGR
jgi:hypothetical protein